MRVLLALISLLFANIVYAAPDPGSFIDTASALVRFFHGTQHAVHQVIFSPELSGFALTLWKFFTAIGIIWLMVLYAMEGASFSKIFGFLFMALITRFLMAQYDPLTSALWEWSETFAGGIQKAAVGTDDIFYLPRYIWDSVLANFVSFPSFLKPFAFLTSLFWAIIIFLLVILSLIATMWALWGYALMKMIGFMLIPCLMFKPLSWLFDGWLKFFMGFLLYNIIARANLVLIVVSLEQYGAHAVEDTLRANLLACVGAFLFLILGILALLSTAGLVRGLIHGSMVSFSDSLRGLSRTIGGILR